MKRLFVPAPFMLILACGQVGTVSPSGHGGAPVSTSANVSVVSASSASVGVGGSSSSDGGSGGVGGSGGDGGSGDEPCSTSSGSCHDGHCDWHHHHDND